MIQNPILPGFNPDPCICRRGDDFYLAVSTFEWMPGVPVYHSRDLKHWALCTHILTDDTAVNLKNLPSAKGIWAPCLTWCPEDGRFWLVYGVMNSMNARYFDVDNFAVSAPDIQGPWSEPVYLHSAGFDASLFHDRDGHKYLVSLQWETRDGYDKPGPISIVEYDAKAGKVLGYPQVIWRGGTDRGCLEAPHLTRHGNWYYLMCAEGGTGYNHCVTMARSRSPFGPYEGDPANPILTSNPGVFREREDVDHLKTRHFNLAAPLQKAGHGSYVDLPNGETYLVYHVSRPFVPELRCTLGRETAIRKMVWTEDGWLRTADGNVLPTLETPEPDLPDAPLPAAPAREDFAGPALEKHWYAPREMPGRFADVTARPGWLRLRGQEALTSTHKVSLLARKLTSLQTQVTTKMAFTPEIPQHDAGLDYLYLRKYWSEALNSSALMVQRMENGVRSQYGKISVEDGPLYLRLQVRDRACWCEWSRDGERYESIGPVFETSRFSDEYCQYGEFTGTMVGLTCADRMLRRQYADFAFFEILTDC